MELPPNITRELDELARRFGPPLSIVATIDDSFKDPIWKRDRHGEVCMVVRRPTGRILLSIKTFYPRGAYRLPTGGIHHGEGVYDALVRETHEETGLSTAVRSFLARISYAPLSSPGAPPVFHTFAFLLDELGGTLGTLDTSERIEEWREIETDELAHVADVLDHLTTQGTEDIGGDWRAWGKFRAVVHRAVADALAS
jgi:8-oxo-dGTP pyrophosphatase MutT (NUDIX family)